VQLRPFRAASPLVRPFHCRIETKNLASTGEQAIAVPPHSYDRQCRTTMLLPQPAPHRLQATTTSAATCHRVWPAHRHQTTTSGQFTSVAPLRPASTPTLSRHTWTAHRCHTAARTAAR